VAAKVGVCAVLQKKVDHGNIRAEYGGLYRAAREAHAAASDSRDSSHHVDIRSCSENKFQDVDIFAKHCGLNGAAIATSPVF
jgi:hypothetical protein